MFSTIESHEKNNLVRLLYSLADAECPFSRKADGCPLQNTTKMTKQERYLWLEAKDVTELECIYQHHSRCALKM